MRLMFRLHLFCDTSKTTQVWLALVPMNTEELKAKVTILNLFNS